MRKVGLVLALLALAALPLLAQDMNIMGAGARARGMGGAFIGVADDATAVGWNPAGIANLDKPEASAVGLFNMKTFKNEWSYNDPTIPYDTSATEDWLCRSRRPTAIWCWL
jgi:long-subunit fatty acid transport protein